MANILTYNGEEPKLVPPENQIKILEIMLKQLEVMKQMSQQTWLIPAGTKLVDSTPPRRRRGGSRV